MKTLLLLLLLVAGSYGWVCIHSSDCPEGSECKDGECEPVSRSFALPTCPPGTVFVGGRCVGRPDRFYKSPCPTGMAMGPDGVCVQKPSRWYFEASHQNRCPAGQMLVDGGRCVDFTSPCGLGEIEVHGRCMPGTLRNFDQTPCPPGQVIIGLKCKNPPFPNFPGRRCPINHSLEDGKCIKCNPPKNPCSEGQYMDCGCHTRSISNFFGTCTHSLECPDNRKCVNGVCLAV